MKPEIIESAQALEHLCDELSQQEFIAVDTEFARETTYYPHLGLVQLASNGRIACVDPLAFDARPQLTALMQNRSVTKIFHACLQDLEVLELTLGVLPCPLFDTQLAHALMNEDHQISYARLVTAELDIHLPKTETRTNWLKRPLSPAQLEYAADDVRYLLDIQRKQQAELQEVDRDAWLQDECTKLCSRSFVNQVDYTEIWTRVKGKERLRPHELVVLQEAAIWREQQAINNDRPRRRILKDDLMIEIAVRQPNNSTELARIGNINRILEPAAIDSLAEAINSAHDKPESAWPSNRRRQLSEGQNKALTAVLAHIKSTANRLGISQGMLCNRKNAEKLVLGNRDLPVLSGWRLEYIGSDLLQLVDQTSN
jgi:ribonuclease D